jgi:hypothetical protein
MFRRLAILSACAVALTLIIPAAANADSRTLIDARGDVWAMDTPDVGQNTQAPERQHGDILRTVFAHNSRQVVMRTKFAQLDRVGSMSIMAIKLRTNTGAVRRIALLAGPGSPETHRWRGIVTRRNAAIPMECATHRIDYAADVAEVRIPRSCLGDPRWVQGSLGAGTLTKNGTFFGDNPVNEGPTVHLPRYTSRIRNS